MSQSQNGNKRSRVDGSENGRGFVTQPYFLEQDGEILFQKKKDGTLVDVQRDIAESQRMERWARGEDSGEDREFLERRRLTREEKRHENSQSIASFNDFLSADPRTTRAPIQHDRSVSIGEREGRRFSHQSAPRSLSSVPIEQIEDIDVNTEDYAKQIAGCINKFYDFLKIYDNRLNEDLDYRSMPDPQSYFIFENRKDVFDKNLDILKGAFSTFIINLKKRDVLIGNYDDVLRIFIETQINFIKTLIKEHIDINEKGISLERETGSYQSRVGTVITAGGAIKGDLKNIRYGEFISHDLKQILSIPLVFNSIIDHARRASRDVAATRSGFPSMHTLYEYIPQY